MDAFEINKIAGSVLATILALFGLSFVGDFIFHSEAPAQPGYEIAAIAPEGHGGGGGDAPAAAEESALAMLADASVADGEKVAKKCAACHTFEKGGPNKVGPNLWEVVNRKPGVHEGFAYSNAVTEFGGTTNWTFEALDHYLTNPKAALPGNKMSFAGLKKAEDRAAMLAYLRSLSDSPAPLLAAGDTAAAAPEAPKAEGESNAEAAPAAETQQPAQ